jgi:hypothetical protein
MPMPNAASKENPMHAVRLTLGATCIVATFLVLPASADDGFQPLFGDAASLANWSVRQWNDVSQPADDGVAWSIADGVLRGSDPRGTWLISRQEYGDFVLEFEWKLGDRGNGGCGLRFPETGDPAFDGLELQMVDPRYYGDAGAEMPAAELTGGLYRSVAPTEQRFKPNDWNKYSVTCRGAQITVELNGEQILDVNLDEQTTPTRRHDGSEALPLKDRPRRGHIGFQELSRSGHVEIRNARIKVLD